MRCRIARARLPAELPCQDGEAQGIGTDGGVAIVRGFRRRKRIGKAPNDGVVEFVRRRRARASSEPCARRLAETLKQGAPSAVS